MTTIAERYARKESDLLPCPMKGCDSDPRFHQDNIQVVCHRCGFMAKHKYWQELPRVGEQTRDGLPCPGTCVQLASDLEDVRVEDNALPIEIERLRAELEEEKRLHEGDHEILKIITGHPRAHMWRPEQARVWLEAQQAAMQELDDTATEKP